MVHFRGGFGLRARRREEPRRDLPDAPLHRGEPLQRGPGSRREHLEPLEHCHPGGKLIGTLRGHAVHGRKRGPPEQADRGGRGRHDQKGGVETDSVDDRWCDYRAERDRADEAGGENAEYARQFVGGDGALEGRHGEHVDH